MSTGPGELVWTPAPQRAGASQMHAFMMHVAQRYGIAPQWEALHAWSVRDADAFWSEMLDLAQVEPSAPANCVRSGSGMLAARWFPGMRLNYARRLLRHADEATAIVVESEQGSHGAVTFGQLRAEVARVAAGLRADGVRRGDRVAGYLPNITETVVAMLAAASLGAVWSSCSPDFGVGAVLDRFGQIEPRVLVTAAQYVYGGRRFALGERLQEICGKLPSLKRVVIVGDAAADAEPRRFAPAATPWATYGQPGAALTFEEVPFDHPLYILYSSGTTGVPKCIVHGHGGTLLQHMKELMLHVDLRAGDRLFYFTTCGWMMWNWLVSGLGVGAAIVLFDGNPAHPTIDRLWQLAAERGVHVFGASPKFLSACEKAHLRPCDDHDLSPLRTICSTGSPLAPEQFGWVRDAVKADVQLASISGGTDIVSCFMLGNPLLPVYAGEIQSRGLGMDVQAWDEAGRPVVGQKGELVCCTPFPSQPVGFWNDPDGAKYRRAYFEHYPGVWRHGDYVEITERGGVVVFGRSDATLNPGGVRIGTAEIYRCVEAVPEVLDSIAVGRRTDDNDEQIVLFVVLRPGVSLDAALRERIRSAIAQGASKRHVPRHIRQVPDIPYTISGKKVERAVQQVLHGDTVENRDALRNPAALDAFPLAMASGNGNGNAH